MRGSERRFVEPIRRCRVRWQVRVFDGLFLLLVAAGTLAVIRWMGGMMARWEGGPWA